VSTPSYDLRRRFGRLTCLNILSNITVPLASLIDVALLGHMPDIRFLAGVALASILLEYFYWTFGFLRMGTTGLAAQAQGREDQPELYRLLYQSLILAIGIGLALLLLQWPMRELGFSLLSGAPGVEEAGRAYFDARIWGAPAVLANFAFLGWYLGREESGHALVMTVVANLSNIACNYVLIIHMGLAAWGAGLGTAISQYLMLATAFLIFRRIPGRLRWRQVEVWDPAALWALLRLNRDILIRTVSLITAFALFTNFSSILGTITLAANAILLRFLSFAAYLIDGAAFATESLAGYFRGRGDRDSLHRLFRLALLTGIAFALPFMALFALAPAAVTRLVTTHGPTTVDAIRYSWWLAPTLLFGATAYIYDGLFLGLTAGRPLRNAMLISTLVVFLPLAMAATRWQNNDLLWASLVAFMVARTVTLWWAGRYLPVFGASES
jgi:MATE family multidrug resistance protein